MECSFESRKCGKLSFRNTKVYQLREEGLKTNKDRFISTAILEKSEDSQVEILSFKACHKIRIEDNQYDDFKKIVLIEDRACQSIPNKDNLNLIKINKT